MYYKNKVLSFPPEPPSHIKDLSIYPELLPILEEQTKKLGDIFRVESPTRKNYLYVINHPDYVRQVLQKNHKKYIKGVGYDRVGMLLGNGLIVSNGDLWKQRRQMIQPAFHKRVLEQLSDLIIEANQELNTKWHRLAQQGALVDVQEDMSELTLYIILRALFSEDVDLLIDQNGVNPFQLLLTKETDRNLLFAQKFRALGKPMLEIVKRRRYENRWPRDFVGMMMTAKDKKTGKGMSDKQLLDEIFTLIVAGHETTASSLMWIWYLLSKHPEIERNVHNELVTVLGNGAPNFEHLDLLTYTQSVIDEALRLYPPGWLIPRRAQEADVIGGFNIPEGSDIFICPYLLHRDRRWWNQPDEFVPERFQQPLKSSTGYFYIPFSQGPRKCIGDYFSFVEMKFHLALLVPSFRLREIKPQTIELAPQINLRSKHPIYLQPNLK